VKRRRTFKGGYRFGKLMGSPRATLSEMEPPDEVVIPLRQGFGEAVPSIVKAGDKVRAGQIIGINDASCSSPVHATVSGTVKDVRTVERLGQQMDVVVIESDGSRGWLKMDLPSTDPGNNDPDEIGKALYISGVASLPASGFPTRYNTSHLQPDDVDSLLVNAVNSEPFALSNEVLLAGSVDKFLTGVDILRRALPGGVKVYIGIDDRDKEIIKQMETAADWLHVCPLKPKYPQDHDVVLIKTILGRKIPYSGSASDVRAVVLDVQSVLHAYEAVVEGKPVIERVVALGGSGLSENLFVKVRVGTPLKHIIASRIKCAENRYIYGGVMTGAACDDLSIPVDRTVSSIAALQEDRDREFLSFLRPGINRGSFSNTFLSSLFPNVSRKIDTNTNGEYRPCIYCNYCEDVCPVDLVPYLLSKYVTHDMIEEADRHRILACIDCGLCTYVCPSKIPLMTHIQEGKTRISREDRESHTRFG
jgi:electron transport complex protein RnfC